jgi:dipeptidyl aminopeptidase/acylaminoacyl peptidase
MICFKHSGAAAMLRTCVFAAGLMLAIAAGIQSRDITYDDLYSIPSCRDPQISPDSKQIVYVLRTSDPKANTRKDHLWLMAADGTGARQLTFGAGESHPRWSSDGRSILFLCGREDGTQIWSLPLSGGEARKVTSVPTSVGTFDCSPAGHKAVLVSRVFPQCTNDSCARAALADDAKNPDKPLLVDDLLFRHYNRWADGRVNRLILADLDSLTHHDLYSGPFDAPTSALGGESDFAVSPDGKEVCFSMTTDSMPAVWPNNDLYLIDMATGNLGHLTTDSALELAPNFSPDGRYLAYLATARAGYESDQRDLVLYDRLAKVRRNLTASFDRSLGEYLWDSHSRYIYFTAWEFGHDKVWRIEIASGRIEKLLGDAVYGDLHISPDGRFLALSRSQSDQPSELYRFDLSTHKLTRLTNVTTSVTAGIDLRRVQTFWFVGFLGDSVQGFLTLPPKFDSTRKYPLVLLIHGGPEYAWSEEFNYYGWNTQLTAAQGYVVAQINPHGSSGYGVKFQDYVSGNWGKGDFEDLMKGVDWLTKSRPYIDSTRMAAMGRSYGGFMVNWICGHTDRFRCLVTTDGTFNHLADYGASDELWFPEWEMKGTPWSNQAEYLRSSPSSYVANFHTPTLVIHGQKDYRVDLSDGLAMFTSLQRQKVPSQLLYFPNEGHNVGRLENLRVEYQRQFEWLARWLK